MRHLLALLAVTACGGAQRPDMSEGERTYRAKCTSCHRAYEPGERKDWPAVLDKMQTEKKTHLNPDERAQILAFLRGNSVMR